MKEFRVYYTETVREPITERMVRQSTQRQQKEFTYEADATAFWVECEERGYDPHAYRFTLAGVESWWPDR